MTNDDIREMLEDALKPINITMLGMQASIDEIKRGSISRIEYDPAVAQLRSELRTVKRAHARLRKRLDTLWTRVLITIGGAASLIYVLIQISGSISIKH